MTPETGTTRANGIDIAYETFGDVGDKPILLIMGLGSQLIAWPDELCADLAAAADFVIRFDNRDVGLSSHFPALGEPSPLASALRRTSPPYRLDDMADDAAGLLGALGLGSAHIVGASMGGFIAQTLALRHPERVRSLTLIMTSTGSRRVGRPRPRIVARLGRRRRQMSRDESIASVVATFRAIGSPGFPYDEARIADLAGRSYDRSHDVGGYLRQLAAIMAQPDRTLALKSISVPTVVIHGLSDPLVGASGGRSLAAAIPGATFVGLPGMGHDLPREIWGRLGEEITTVAGMGERRLEAFR
jgi:pimeloyl-ACP methyl ester carboxylesterase